MAKRKSKKELTFPITLIPTSKNGKPIIAKNRDELCDIIFDHCRKKLSDRLGLDSFGDEFLNWAQIGISLAAFEPEFKEWNEFGRKGRPRSINTIGTQRLAEIDKAMNELGLENTAEAVRVLYRPHEEEKIRQSISRARSKLRKNEAI